MKQKLSVSLPLQNQVRLWDLAEEHAVGWMSVVPNGNLGSRFAKGAYQLLLEFHLGLPLLPAPAVGHHPATNLSTLMMFSLITS